METPDGKTFAKDKEPAPRSAQATALLRVAGAALSILLRFAGRMIMIALRAFGKFVITTWRLAAALDSALWRATKLIARRLWEATKHGLALLGQVIRSFILWLPTRTGRAYSAVSGVVLVIALLWIADALRAGPGEIAGLNDDLRAPVDEGDPILARIGGRYVHLSEIEAAARAGGQLQEGESLTPALAFERGLVETYVEQRLLARAAQDTGIHRTPSVLRRVNAARDRILAASLIQSRINEEVTPETVARYYNEQRKIMEVGDEVRARHILVETGAEAEEIVALLEGGADFGALARERSLDRATAPLGGEIGWFSRRLMARNFANAAFRTPVGEIAPPFQTDYGWHVVEVLGRRPTNAKPFEELRDDIEEFLVRETVAETLRDLQDENRVVYYRPEVDSLAQSEPPAIEPGEAPEQFSELRDAPSQ